MEWWQVLLIFLAALAVGELLGTGLYFRLKLLAKRREMAPMIKKQQFTESVIKEPAIEEPVIEEPVIEEPVIEEPVIEEPVIEEPVIEEPVIEEPVIEEPVIEEPATEKAAKATPAEFFEEIENNLEIAARPWADELLPFQTRIWEVVRDDIGQKMASSYDDLQQIYADIRLANNIVRLATNFNRRTKGLDESYRTLCTSIANTITSIKPQIERSK